MVTGYAIKKGKHYNDYMQTLHHKGTTGSIIFRGTEALLNYMEACYEKMETLTVLLIIIGEHCVRVRK